LCANVRNTLIIFTSLVLLPADNGLVTIRRTVFLVRATLAALTVLNIKVRKSAGGVAGTQAATTVVVTQAATTVVVTQAAEVTQAATTVVVTQAAEVTQAATGEIR
jgi:hypothetical protein